MFFLLLIGGAIACAILCPRGGGNNADTTPPKIVCPRDIQPVYFAAKNADKALVRYDMATATDNKKVKEVKQSSGGLKSGSLWPEGNHVVFFMAKDTSGNTATCNINFKVSVRRCPGLLRPKNGGVKCSNQLGFQKKYGDTCTFSCDEGYTLQGTSKQECGRTGTWIGGGSVKCLIKTCPEPAVPANAKISSCTDGHNYDSVCVFTCLAGFSLTGSNERSVKCGADKKWIGNPEACQDSQGPVIQNCPQSQSLYADPNEDYTIVTWEEPTATDNLDTSVTVTLEQGSPSGSKFDTSLIHTITYEAKDKAGNMASPCEFVIDVRQITCPPVPSSWRLSIQCSDKLIYGSTCSFKCEQGYPLIGAPQAKCVKKEDAGALGYWDWGETAPHCDVKECKKLDPPKNGALSCSGWSNGMSCTMQCKKEYDIPRTAPANGLYVCQDTKGTWTPTDKVPDCTTKRTGDRMRLPSELYYFSGDCNSEETQAQIKNNFVESLKLSDFNTLCTLYPDCKAENVRVECGEVKEIRKRSIYRWSNFWTREDLQFEVKIKFDFILEGVYDADLTSEDMDNKAASQFNKISEGFKKYINDGGMNIDGLILEKDKTYISEEGNIDCIEGTVPDYSHFTCEACPTGMFYSRDKMDCSYCAVGFYQDEDGALDCKVCPDGTTTKEEGARDSDQCKKICPAGFYSEDGLVACSPCPENTYTEEIKQTECKPCPPGTYTANTGTDNRLDCVTKFVPENPCASNPCTEHGVCTRSNNTYVCHCVAGYSGRHCEVAPDPCNVNACQNGAICVGTGEGEDDYQCNCSAMFAGQFCQFKRVHGGWSEWSNWTDCSVTCHDGYKTRYRECNSPAPNDYGNDCEGSGEEFAACNLGECPECPYLKRPYEATKQCEKFSNGTVKCIIECTAEGLSKRMQEPRMYVCGADTDYTWSPDIDPSSRTLCSKSTIPKSVKTKIAYSVKSEKVLENDKEAIKKKIKKLVSHNAVCLNERTCEINIGINPDRKRSAAQNIVISLEAVTEKNDVVQEGVFNEGLAMDAVRNIASIEQQFEKVAEAFKAAIEDDSAVVQIGGSVYEPDIESVEMHEIIECESGQTAQQVICMNCPPGTYGDSIECRPCPVGEYQPEEGKNKCLACPSGLTTSDEGSVNDTECTEATRREINKQSQEDEALKEEDKIAYLYRMLSRMLASSEPCANHGCQNGATCIPNEGNDGYTCNCANMYTGKFCLFEIVRGDY